jgi:hypothetical protein
MLFALDARAFCRKQKPRTTTLWHGADVRKGAAQRIFVSVRMSDQERLEELRSSSRTGGRSRSSAAPESSAGRASHSRADRHPTRRIRLRTSDTAISSFLTAAYRFRCLEGKLGNSPMNTMSRHVTAAPWITQAQGFPKECTDPDPAHARQNRRTASGTSRL